MSAASPDLGAGQENVAFVVASGVDVGDKVARGLARAGSQVALLGDGPAAESFDGVTRFPTSFASRAQVDRGFAAAVQRLGPPRLVVVSALPAVLLSSKDSADFPARDWASAVHGAAKAALYCLQSAHAYMVKSAGGTIVCMGPSLALVGAAGLVALSTVLESQRSLVKSAARQWGRLGIRVHWIALGAGENYPTLRTAALPNGPEIGPPPPPLGRVPDLERDVATIAAFLAGSGGRGLTGCSLVADGGDWMVP
jgi:NAD(P)-dependent dehydrogenase (short-subunit alcohol dehydrogenase family)